MKIFSTLTLILFLAIPGNKAYCQNQNEVNDPCILPKLPVMNRFELAEYRLSLWDSLPGAIGWVNDFEGLFSNEEENILESLIAHFEQKTSIEIMIVTIDTNMVSKEKFGDFSEHIMRIWGIGKKMKKNGIIICISSGYQEIRITTDLGIEKYMTEIKKLQILKKNFLPHFEKNNYYEGTFKGLNALLSHLSKRAYVL